MKLKENDKIPSAEVFLLENGEPIKKDIKELLKDKKVVLFGLPGAYTSVCSAKHLPGYVNTFDKYKSKGVDHIICMSANDPFVMDAWGKSQNVENKILMIGDPFLNFTKSIGAEVDKSGRGLGIRSNRYTMLIDNLKVVKIQEEKETGSCEISAAENFLKLI
jgi:peroxiredoxin